MQPPPATNQEWIALLATLFSTVGLPLLWRALGIIFKNRKEITRMLDTALEQKTANGHSNGNGTALTLRSMIGNVESHQTAINRIDEDVRLLRKADDNLERLFAHEIEKVRLDNLNTLGELRSTINEVRGMVIELRAAVDELRKAA